MISSGLTNRYRNKLKFIVDGCQSWKWKLEILAAEDVSAVF